MINLSSRIWRLAFVISRENESRLVRLARLIPAATFKLPASVRSHLCRRFHARYKAQSFPPPFDWVSQQGDNQTNFNAKQFITLILRICSSSLHLAPSLIGLLSAVLIRSLVLAFHDQSSIELTAVTAKSDLPLPLISTAPHTSRHGGIITSNKFSPLVSAKSRIAATNERF